MKEKLSKKKPEDLGSESRELGTVIIEGRPGDPFSITGTGFGNEEGVLLVGLRQIATTRWIDRSIKGMLPEDLESGAIVLRTGNGHFVGTFRS